MITGSKFIELFCIIDNFCKFFDVIMSKYMLKLVITRTYYHIYTMSKNEIIIL